MSLRVRPARRPPRSLLAPLALSLVAVVAIGAIVAACAAKRDDYVATVAPPLSARDARMQWWREARFGLFVHWGLYAIPAGEWKERTDHGEWIRDTAQIPLDEYERLLAQWNPVKFDAEAWVGAAKAAGMRYVVITTKHHDGFCNFDSALTDWDVMSTPFHRDVMKEMADACRRQGMQIGWYHSIMDWHHPDYLPRRVWEAADRPSAGADFDRFRGYLAGQVTELLTNYGPIGVMWFDGEWEGTWTHAHGLELDALCRRLQPAVIVDNRVDVGRNGMQGLTKEPAAGAPATTFAGDFGTPEQEVPPTGIPGVDWETCMTMNDHWGFNAKDANWKSSRDLIRTLCDVASKGGNLLLNVGPRADGSFPEPCLERLRDIGRWMDVNGEAIHGTTASPFDELRFGRCTAKYEPRADGSSRSRLFFHLFEWPRAGLLLVPTIGNRIVRASLLAEPERELRWAVPGKGLAEILIQLPVTAPDPVCTVVALEIEGAPIVHRAPAIRAANDDFVRSLQVELAADPPGSGVRYTLDGSDPDAGSPEYARPLELAGTTTVTARTFVGGNPVSPSRARRFTQVAPWRCAAAGREPGVARQLLLGRFDALPDVADMVANAETIVPAIALDEVAGKGNVALVFDGVLTVPADELYEFALTSADGARLLIDSRLVVDHDGLHAATTRSGFAPLAAGPHRIWLGWFNRRAGAGEPEGNAPRLELRWAPVGGVLAPIAPASLSH